MIHHLGFGHLSPVLQDIKERYQDVTTLHFISEWPTSTSWHQQSHFVQNTVTWNFMEAGHGKGAQDGVGVMLKWNADSLVAQGKDISNAWSLYESWGRASNWGGPLMPPLVPTPPPKYETKWSGSPRLALKAWTVAASLMLAGRWFHSAVVLGMNEYL